MSQPCDVHKTKVKPSFPQCKQHRAEMMTVIVYCIFTFPAKILYSFPVECTGAVDVKENFCSAPASSVCVFYR